MKILDLQQNTSEWEELRRTKIGASDCPIIVGKSPYKTAFDLWEEKIQGKKSHSSMAMQYGSMMEPIARAHYHAKYSLFGEPKVLQHEHLDYMIASVDCVLDDHILEIKCPQSKVLEEAKRGKPQEYWVWQVQHQLEVSGKEKAIIFVYDHEKPEESAEFEIRKDEEMIAELLEAEREFYQCMINFEPPQTKQSQLILREDREWIEAEDAWEKAKKALEEATELEKICREGLIYLSEEKPSKGFKIALTKVFKSGRVDYSKIPELQGVDLEKYRKPGYSCWTIRSL